MGRKPGNHLSASMKRKCRSQIMRNVWKKMRNGSRSDNLNNIALDKFDINLEKTDVEHSSNFDVVDHSEDDVFLVEDDSSQNVNYELHGRRIVDIGHLLTSLKSIEHKGFGCSFYDVEIINEKQLGLKSIFTHKCKICGIVGKFCTENEASSYNINDEAVCGVVAAGAGYTQFTEFCSSLDIPQMSYKTYQKSETKIHKNSEKLAYDEMLVAGKEEYRLAVEAGDIDDDGVPFITVVVDGAWSKRSYKSNYNALSGVACIIGARTKKILFVGVKNKLCKFCHYYEKLKKPVRVHKCFKNWNGTSTSMEAELILDGFKKSIAEHGLRFKKIIGDGDSSVAKKIRINKPYGPTYFVEKIECRNHLLRNYCNKIREISKMPRTDLNIRNFMRNNIFKFRTAIVSAIKYRKSQNISVKEKIEKLKLDILNGPSHIFGDHTNCDEYYCTKKGQSNSLQYSMFSNSPLFDKFFPVLNRVANFSESLLYDVDNNMVESYNSVVNKFVGGKRVNYSGRGGYQVRCLAAVVSFNNQGTYVHKLINKIREGNVGMYTKQFSERKLKQHNVNRFKRKLFNKIRTQSADSDYGKCDSNVEAIEDMSLETYNEKKESFLSTLSQLNVEHILEKTCGQRQCHEWEKERHLRLTASNFGKICKMRETTNTANTIKTLLCIDKFHIKNKPTSIQYGIDHEEQAIIKFQNMTGFRVTPCGLYVDKEKAFLGASPDGLVGQDSIIEVKCPFSARDKRVIDAVNESSIKFCMLDPKNGSEILLKTQDKYMYQVQGQLHITGRQQCYFVVYTQVDMKYCVIDRDDEFWDKNMLPHLQKFYLNAMLPEIIDSRYKRNLPLRNILKKDL